MGGGRGGVEVVLRVVGDGDGQGSNAHVSYDSCVEREGGVAGAFACERKRHRAEALDEGEQGPGQEASTLVPWLSHAH